MADAGELALLRCQVGTRLAIPDPAVWFADPGRLRELRDLADAHLVVHIALGEGLTPDGLGALGLALGCPGGPYPDRPGTLPGWGFIADFASPAREDDGRDRVPTWIETLHFDGDSAYSVQANLVGTPMAPMRFVDMAALYAGLPERLKAAVDGAMALVGHLPPTNMPMSAARPLDPERAKRAPLVVRHPRTGVPVLRPPKSPHSTIEGLSDDEGRAILAELWALAAASPHAYEAVIGPGEMVIWEGTQAAHTNPAFPRATGRRTWFYTVPAAWDALEAFT
jgi:hypothetical protein